MPPPLMDWFDANGFLWHLVLAHGLIAVFAVYRMTRRSARPLSEQRHYPSYSTRTSAMAAAIATEVVIEAESEAEEDAR